MVFWIEPNMTHSSPGMCIDRRPNPHSFASPSYSRWTSPSAPRDQVSVSRLRRARSLFQIEKMPLFDVPRYALQTSNIPNSNVTNTFKCNKHRIASFQSHGVLVRARARGDTDYGEGLPARARGIPPLELRRYFPFANADVAFQLP